MLARYGGEEFCLLVNGAAAAGAVATLQRLRAATPPEQTFSAGVAVWNRTESPQQLLERADPALYEAKRGGGTASSWPGPWRLSSRFEVVADDDRSAARSLGS